MATEAIETTLNLRLTCDIEGGILRPISEETEALLRPINIGPHDQLEISIWKDLQRFQISCFKRFAERGSHYISDVRIGEWCERIPDSKVDDKGRIIAPATDFTVVVICALWPADRIFFTSEIAREVFEMLVMQWKLYFIAAKQQAEFKEFGILSPLAQSFPNPPGLELTPYQRCAAGCAAIVPGFAFFMGMGSGKTASAIATIDYLAAVHAAHPTHEGTFRVLVEPPKNVRINWELELRKFSTLRHRVHYMPPDAVGRVRTLLDMLHSPNLQESETANHFEVLILSYGLVPNIIQQLTAMEWDLGIADELHYLQNSSTARTIASLQLRDSCKARLGLTGTPIPNKVADLYTQLEFLGKGFSGFASKKAFQKYYVDSFDQIGPDGIPTERIIGLKNVPLLKERLARMSFIISTQEAVKDLPEIVYDVIGVDMTPQQQALYKKVLEEIEVNAEAELANAGTDGRNYVMVLQNVLTQMLRLTQITSGFFVSSELKDDYGNTIAASEIHDFTPNPKLNAWWEGVKGRPLTSKTITWTCYKRDVHNITQRAKAEGLDFVTITGGDSDRQRMAAIEAFNTSKYCQHLIGNSAAGGIGINLLGQADDYTNCDWEIFYSQNWSSPVRQQAEHRPYRKGSRVTMRCTDLMVPGTIDQEIRECVVEKRTQSYAIQDIRRIVGRLVEGLGALNNG